MIRALLLGTALAAILCGPAGHAQSIGNSQTCPGTSALCSAPAIRTETATYLAKIYSNACTAPTAAWLAALNNVVDVLMAYGAWTSYDAIYVLGAADQCTAKINLKNPATLPLTVNGTLTFTAYLGYTGDGATGWLSNGTNWNGQTNCVQNSCHDELWVAAIGTGGNILGSSTTTGNMSMSATTSTQASRIMSTTQVSDSASGGVGFHVANRNNSATIDTFKNGAILSNAVANVSSVPGANTVAFFRVNATFGADQLSEIGYGASISTALEPTVYNAWNTFLQSGSGAIH